MSTRKQSAIDQEAQRWVVRMHSDQVTREDERRFALWLDNDDNRQAYERARALWAGVGQLRDNAGALDALASLREDAQPSGSRRGFITALAGGAAAASIGGAIGWQILFGTEAYATAIGEQRRIVLADGSTVTLNTDTALRVRLEQNERKLWLDKGQAFFAVSHDANRPFRVFVGEDEVRATGTAFDVRRDGAAARVTVEDGSVAIYRDGAARIQSQAHEAPAAVVSEGKQIAVAPAEPIQISTVDTRRTGAWRFGQMVLEADPLSGAVAEINRYNARQIIIADPSLNDMALNGVFQTGRPEAFVETLTAAFPVDIKAQDEHAIYLARRPLPPPREH